jgi:nucleolar protein 56
MHGRVGSPRRSTFLDALLLQATDDLKTFLTTNLPKVKKDGKAKFKLGLADAKLGSAVQEETSIPCECNEFIGELMRGVRLHFTT